MTFAKGGYAQEYESLPKYKKAILNNASVHTDFLSSRKKLIVMKQEDPGLSLQKVCDALNLKRTVNAVQDDFDEMEAPKDQFWEVWKYKKIMKKEPEPSMVKTIEFRGKKLTGVWVIPEEEQGIYTRSKKAKNGVQQSTSLVEFELQDGQAEQMMKQTAKAILASPCNADSVMLKRNSTGGSASCSSSSGDPAYSIVDDKANNPKFLDSSLHFWLSDSAVVYFCARLSCQVSLSLN
jgi:hypothetical protein